MKKSALILPVLLILAAITACAFSRQLNLPTSTPAASIGAGTPSNCPASFPVAFRVAVFSGVKTALWYPSATPEQPFAYSRDISTSLAKDGQPLTGCGTFPLVIFSHGLTGCGTQSIFFTETLARHGYVVAAPDHQDALLCSVDGTPQTFATATEPAIMDPKTWNDTSYVSRKDDIEHVLDGVLQDSQLQPIIDPAQIGIAGHSLGGYTALAMVGGWLTWKDPRFKAALLLSPYSMPFSIQNTLGGVNVPLMYQGAQGDIGITPFLEGRLGAYANSEAPKYFVKLLGGNHFTWTNAVCYKLLVLADCLQSRPEAQLINEYAFAFFDHYLKGIAEPVLATPNSALAGFQYQP